MGLFLLSVRLSTSVLKDLVMIPVHTKPEDSEKELDELYDVFLNVTQKWATDVRRRRRRQNQKRFYSSAECWTFVMPAAFASMFVVAYWA